MAAKGQTPTPLGQQPYKDVAGLIGALQTQSAAVGGAPPPPRKKAGGTRRSRKAAADQGDAAES